MDRDRYTFPGWVPPPSFIDLVIRYELIRNSLLAYLNNEDIVALRNTTNRLTYFGSVPPFVDMICRYIPVQNSLLWNMEVIDIINLSRTTKAFAGLYQTTMRTQYNIDRALEPFFSSPKAFRNVQAKADAIIAGHFAIDFFDRVDPVRDEAYFQILVEKGPPLDAILAYIHSDEWEQTQDTGSGHPELDGFRREIRFSKVSRASKTKEKDDPTYRLLELHVLIATRSPLFTLLTGIFLTHGLVLITWSHAYCLLPALIYGLRKAHYFDNATRHSRQIISRHVRYARRDFNLTIEPIDIRDTLKDNNEPKQRLINGKPSRVDLGPRCLTDRHTWSIALSVEGIDPSPSPPILTTHATFIILAVPHPDETDNTNPNRAFPTAHYQVHVELVNAPCLKHRYITFPCSLYKQAPHVCLERYKEISHCQLESMDVEDRPADYNALGTSDMKFRWQDVRPVYEPPGYWKYFDEEVQEMLRDRWDLRPDFDPYNW